MKKMNIKIAAILLIGSISIIGCGESKSKDSETKTEVTAEAYYCPMKCEGDKTFADKDTKCPKCGMDLVKK